VTTSNVPGPRGWRGRAVTVALGVVAAVLPVLCALPVLPAAAAVAGGGGGGAAEAFGITPMPGRDGLTAPYFVMTLAAGRSASATALIRNLGTSPETLKVSRSTGTTAANGGSAFVQAFQDCAGVGCWITGLPPAVTLPAGAAEELGFRVHVPGDTPDGQYLAGITVEAAAGPQPEVIGSGAGTTARAIIIQQVTVGVAVNVGPRSLMRTRFLIRGVTGDDIGPTARLNIQLANTGQTFARGTGQASCSSAGRQHSFPVYASTILPHEEAVIAVNAPGLPEGAAASCTVQIGYGHGLAVSWAGPVAVPAPPHVRVIHPQGGGSYAVIPADSPPAWAIALVVLGALILAVLTALLLRTFRRTPPRYGPAAGSWDRPSGRR
jgi:hypothetical protein